MKSVLLLTLAACGVVTQGTRVEKIQECNAQCAKGIHCRTKARFSFGSCKPPAEYLISSAIHSVNISTVMKCEGRHRCSLQLSLTSLIQISKHLHGIDVCVTSPGMLKTCSAVFFPIRTRESLDGQKVGVHHGCFQVRPDQQVKLTLNTIPNYCNLAWSQVYYVQGCHNNDLRENVPECITGKIAYSVDEERRQLSVRVWDMLEDKNYRLRLCHKAFVCTASEERLLEKDNPNKTATFQYSRALPCLCIEGWSTMIDAPRIQVCPFVNRTAELWHGVTFNPEDQALLWESACPVKATVTLCQLTGEHLCRNLVNSSQEVLGRKKVVYSKVDVHPHLCVKFSTDLGSWIKCPFQNWTFPAWNLTITSTPGHPQALLTSKISAKLSLRLCQRNESTTCENIGSVSTEKLKHVAVNLTTDVCRPDVCIQVERTDVDFSPQILLCNFECSDSWPAGQKSENQEVIWILLLAAVYLTVAVLALFTVYVILQIYDKK